MGAERGRGAALNPALSLALADTLARAGLCLAGAARPWWVIGSAAVVLHGGATEVRDVDVLLSMEDALRVATALELPDRAGDGDARFRSAMLLRWTAPQLAVEFMAALEVRCGGGWRPVAPRTREARGGVYVPTAGELCALLSAFGRPKDLARRALLTPPCGTA